MLELERRYKMNRRTRTLALTAIFVKKDAAAFLELHDLIAESCGLPTAAEQGVARQAAQKRQAKPKSSSRKYVLPLLEYFDYEKISKRLDEKRIML